MQWKWSKIEGICNVTKGLTKRKKHEVSADEKPYVATIAFGNHNWLEWVVRHFDMLNHCSGRSALLKV